MLLRGVTLKRASEEIGGDKPFSVRTISASIAPGDLEAYGERGRRRVTWRPIETYLDVKRGIWHENANQPNDVSVVLAIRVRHRTGRGARSFPNEAVEPGDAIGCYGGWRLDQAGEELLRTPTCSTPGLLQLIAPLRDTCRASWEGTLIQWSDLWAQAGCPTSPFSTVGTWASHCSPARLPR